MKNIKYSIEKKHPTFVAAALVLLCLTTMARANYAPDFSAPPYTAGNTILGVDGWDYRFVKDENTEETAYVESVSLRQEKTTIVLEKASLKNVLFEPVRGERMSITFSVALEPSEQTRRGRQFRIWFDGSSIGEVFYAEGEEGGLGYHGVGDGRTGGTICVPAMDFAQGSFYTFVINIDASTQTYKISVTGEKSDGSPLSYTSEGVEFLTPGTGIVEIKGIYIISGPHLKAYLGSLAIESE